MQEYLGPYRLLSQIRYGRTCQIWEVMHDDKGQKFALKVLPSTYAKDREQLNFMKHELVVGRGLTHPNVIQIYEMGVDRGNYYLAMDLCRTNLKQLIHQGVEPLFPRIREIFERAALGLDYFHSCGWVHRDIKPDNFLLHPQGDLKLIDFALASRLRRGLMKLVPGRRSSVIQGTRSYMSPEQIRGMQVDRRSDIYSFGCMLHELLGGKPPFTGSSTNDLLNKHLKSPPPTVLAANRNVTEGMAQLIRRMLSKQPKQRPQDLTEFLAAFNSLEIFKEPPAVPPAKPAARP